MALGLPFPFQQAQYAQVFPLKPASFCKLSAGLSSTNKSATSFFLSFSLTLALFSPLCPLLRLSFYLNLIGRSGRNSFLFLSVLSGYKWVLGHTFFSGNDAADELVRRGALLASSAITCSLSFPIYHIHFSRTGGVLSHLNLLTPRFPLFPPRNLCSLVTLAVFSLVFAATDTAYYQALISLGLAESRILCVALTDTRPRASIISFCIVHLRILCAARFLATLCLCTTSGPDPRELPGFWGIHGLPLCLHSSEGIGQQQHQQQR